MFMHSPPFVLRCSHLELMRTKVLEFEPDMNRTIELAAMVDENGLLSWDRGFPLSRAQVPSDVRLEGKVIVWRPPWETGEKVDPRGMLDAFLTIKGGKDVVRFARRFGVLAICEHGLPSSHDPTCRPLGMVTHRRADGAWWEPVAAWLHFVRQARAVLSIAAALYGGQAARRQDWEAAYDLERQDWATLYGGDASPVEDLVQEQIAVASGDAEMGRIHLAHLVNEWLTIGNVRPRVRWDYDHELPRFELTGGTFGLLAAQMMVAISRSHGVAVCSGCGSPYERLARRPKPGQRNFCPGCRKRVAPRVQKRDWRARKRTGGRQ